MARYNVLLDGMLAASQTTAMPGFIIERLLLPRAKHTAAGASVAPLGLRRIESALVEGGLAAGDMIVVDDAHLAEAIGERTKIVAISSGEPVGLGMSSSTMAGVTGGEIYPQAMLRRLLSQVRRLVAERAPGAKVVLGGPGAWQLAGEDGQRLALGVDHAVVGYAEGNAAATFQSLLQGTDLPPVILGEGVPAARIPRLRGATAMGVVEISRGCGLGCEFCTIGTVPMQHLPLEAILADIKVNLAAGQTSVAILSEDLLRYGGEGMRCRPEALIGLLTAIRAMPEVRALQPDHVNVISLTEYSDEELAEVRRLLKGQYPWFNLGMETAAGELLQACGGRPKMGRVRAEDWGGFCAEQLRRLMRLGFVPMASLIVGLPGETPEQVQQTLQWVRAMQGEPLTIFPVIYAPVAGEPVPELTRAHWQLMREAYEFNFKWVPRLYWDQQQMAGVPVARRMVIQALGKGNVVMWRRLLRAKQAAASPETGGGA